ncbi:MAG: response regulator, partial [Chloroflexota bacterium]
MALAKKILLVDDTRSAVRAMLDETKQYHVVAVPSGEEGLLEFGSPDYALLIVNAKLPGMDGFEFVRRVRRRTELPVYILAERLSSAERRKGDELDIQGYFVHPFDEAAVLTAVSAI